MCAICEQGLMLNQCPQNQSMTILNSNSPPLTPAAMDMETSEGEEASPYKPQTKFQLQKTEALNLLKSNETLLRMNESLNRLSDFRQRNESRESALLLSESVIRASELIRAKDEKLREFEKMVPNDLRTSRVIHHGTRNSDTQQTRHNISFSVASLLADTRPNESPSPLVSTSSKFLGGHWNKPSNNYVIRL